MTRLPREGRNKTRLIPALGAKGASEFHDKLARHAIGRASEFCTLYPKASLTVRLEGGTPIEGKSWLGSDSLDCREQESGDLGHRMESAAQAAFGEGAERVVIIGTDCPSIDATVLGKAFDALKNADLVFGLADDGGYYLVGMSRLVPEIFRDIPWGGRDVLEKSIAAARAVRIDPYLLASLPDVDFPEDLPAAELALTAGATVSVIIPTFNEEENLSTLLETLKQSHPHEILIADGGSTDRTLEIAAALGLKTVSAPKGRASQMNLAAASATGEFLLFLHADTIPPAGFPEMIAEILNCPGTSAGAFRFKLDDEIGTASLIEALVHLRCELFSNPYGDQGIFLRRSVFENIGGYPEWDILEDCGLIRKARKRGKIRISNKAALTSSRRWVAGGTVKTFFRHQLILAGFSLRIPCHILAHIRL
jgi:hypothetical protein